MSEAVLSRRSKVVEGMELIADIEVIESAVTSVDIAGLGIGKDEEVLLISDIISNAGASSYYLFINDNNVNTNYYSQFIVATNTSVTAASINENRYARIVSNNRRNVVYTDIRLTNSGYFNSQSEDVRSLGTGEIDFVEWYGTSIFTAAAINKITIMAQIASAIGVGSRFQLYKRAGV